VGDRVFHYEAIKRGVQTASGIRVEEVKEDFYWVPTLMEPLRNLVIPCPFTEIRDRWKIARVESLVRKQAEQNLGLPPKHLDQGLEGLFEDMLSLALFSRMQDGRINMPDVYRVGFGLGRKGGVKPIKKDQARPVAGGTYRSLLALRGIPLPAVRASSSCSIGGGCCNSAAGGVEKHAGDRVVGGTGGLLMRAEKVGAETLLARIVAMIAEAQRSRAPIQKLVDVASGYFVPIVVGISILTK
jgi:hypothetical protein